MNLQPTALNPQPATLRLSMDSCVDLHKCRKAVGAVRKVVFKKLFRGHVVWAVWAFLTSSIRGVVWASDVQASFVRSCGRRTMQTGKGDACQRTIKERILYRIQGPNITN